MNNAYIFNVTPRPAPRQVKSDTWNPRPIVVRYREYKDALREAVKAYPDFVYPEARAHIIFYLPMPKSWSKKKRNEMFLQPHQQTPDKDNLEKALMDALLPDGDARVWDSRISKRWATEGYVMIFTNMLPNLELVLSKTKVVPLKDCVNE